MATRVAQLISKRRSEKKTAAASTTMVAIIGAGRGGKALMEIFAKDPLVQIAGIAEVNPRAEGLKLAKRLKIKITRDYQELLALEHVDLLIDVSGNAEVERVLQDFHRMGVTV